MSKSAYNVRWSQPGSKGLEISIPMKLDGPITSRELSVSTEGEQDNIILVSARHTPLWIGELYSTIARDIEWRVEKSKDLLVIDANKIEEEMWPALLHVPLDPNDPFLLTGEQLDEHMEMELPPLPPTSAEGAAEKEKEEYPPLATARGPLPKPAPFAVATEDKDDKDFVSAAAALVASLDATTDTPALPEAPQHPNMGLFLARPAEVNKQLEAKKKSEKGDDDDLDALLDDAVNEMSQKGSTQAPITPYSIAEMSGLKEEEKAFAAKLEELKEADPDSGTAEEKETRDLHIKCSERMLELLRVTSALRRKRTTVANFMTMQHNDLLKAKANQGDVATTDEEEFANAQESSMNGEQLFRAGVAMLEAGPTQFETALHFLRLAALQRKHGAATATLFAIFANTPLLLKGVEVLLSVAASTPDARLPNERIGDLFNSGAPHFPPFWSMAVYFYQRAAISGSAHAISNLAALHLAGETGGGNNISNAKEKSANTNAIIANYMIKKGLERGCLASHLIRAAQQATGYPGVNGAGAIPKDLSKAKYHMTAALDAAPQLLQEAMDEKIANMITLRELQKILASVPSPSASSSSSSSNKESAPSTKVTSTSYKNNDDDIIEMPVRDSSSSSRKEGAVANPLERLQQLRKEQAPAAKAPLAARLGGSDGPADGGAAEKRFWEKAARAAVLGYGVYCIAFPVRVLLLPLYYSVAGALVEGIGLGGPPPSRNLF